MSVTNDNPPKSSGMEKPVKGPGSGPGREGGASRGGQSSGKTNNSSRKNDWIGRQLQRAFDEYAREPIPDDIMSLLDQLGKVETPNPDKGTDKP
jgi:hypothetical protein